MDRETNVTYPHGRHGGHGGRGAAAAVAAGLCAALLAACSVAGPDETTTVKDKQVVVATHDSWAMSRAVLRRFTQQTGYTVKVEPNGDVGQLTNKLVLTKSSPIADVAYGIDNKFATRAVDDGILADYTPPDHPASDAAYALLDRSEAFRHTPAR